MGSAQQHSHCTCQASVRTGCWCRGEPQDRSCGRKYDAGSRYSGGTKGCQRASRCRPAIECPTEMPGSTSTTSSIWKTARELDDATLELLGVEDAQERADLRDKIYRDLRELQISTRDREIIAQHDRRRASRRGQVTPQDIADELWADHQSDLELLQFPEDFVSRLNEGELFDLPPGEVQVGTAMMEGGGLLRTGTIRVGGTGGEVIEVGTVARGRFLESLSLCHRSGQIRLPDDAVCEDAASNFTQYRQELQGRCSELARQRTSDQQRQRAVFNALIRKALQWRRL